MVKAISSLGPRRQLAVCPAATVVIVEQAAKVCCHVIRIDPFPDPF
jgi:hypothetical protein